MPGGPAQLLQAMSPECGGVGSWEELEGDVPSLLGECVECWELQGRPSLCPAGCWRGVRRQQLSVGTDLGWG